MSCVTFWVVLRRMVFNSRRKPKRLHTESITKIKMIGLCKILRNPSRKCICCNFSICAGVFSAVTSWHRVLLNYNNCMTACQPKVIETLHICCTNAWSTAPVATPTNLLNVCGKIQWQVRVVRGGSQLKSRLRDPLSFLGQWPYSHITSM
jgi:hypothetical protein